MKKTVDFQSPPLEPLALQARTVYLMVGVLTVAAGWNCIPSSDARSKKPSDSAYLQSSLNEMLGALTGRGSYCDKIDASFPSNEKLSDAVQWVLQD